MLDPDTSRTIVDKIVAQAIKAGATAADSIYVGSRSTGVEVRLGELDSIDSSEGEKLALRLFVGQRSATVASSDLADESLATLVERALAMAKEAPEDPYAGLAPPEFLDREPSNDLDLMDREEPLPTDLRDRALEAEGAALGVAGVTNSSGAGASHVLTAIAFAASNGFSGAYRASRHGVSASVIAGEGADMQRDYDWHTTRYLADLDSPATIGRRAGEQAAARVGAGRPRAGRMPVLFDPRVSGTLLNHFSGAINGAAVARGTSFLKDRLGERIFASGVRIVDDPRRLRGLRSHPFDGEGVRVNRCNLVEDGVLQQWMADSAAARQLGIDPTGHAVRGTSGGPGAGASNLRLEGGSRSRNELLAAVPEGLLVTELIGHGVNGLTGDYSRGAAGFMVRNGEIAEPVAEITIASNLLTMFATLEPGSDLEIRRGVDAPTIFIPEMTVAAA